MPALPREGDYIQVSRPGQEGTENFIVRRATWALNFPSREHSHEASRAPVGKTEGIFVEVEFARGPHDSANHKRACDVQEGRGKKVRKFEASGY